MNAPGFILLAAFGNSHMNGGWGVLAIVAMVVMMGGMGWMMFSMMRQSQHPRGPGRAAQGQVRPRRTHDRRVRTTLADDE